jgi:hypothetical protein
MMMKGTTMTQTILEGLAGLTLFGVVAFFLVFVF